MKYPLASPSWGSEEKIAAKAVIDFGMCTMGKNVKKFEKEFSNFNESKYSVMVNSGSSANLLMVASLFFKSKNALKAGDEVIVPAVSWPTTYYPLVQYGLKLVFVDIDLYTLNYDLKALDKAITINTRLVVAVNLLGNPNNFTEINRIIENKNIILIEDNCESLGATFTNKKAGSFGVMGSFSTFFSHHISTMEGGVIVTDDEELYHIMLSLRAHGWTRDLPRDNFITGTKSDNPFEESFNFVLPGYNVRPLEVEAAIGLEQLKKLPDFLNIRKENADLFFQLFSSDERFYLQKELGSSSWFGFSILIKKESGIIRKELVEKLISNNIECRPIVAGNFTKNKVFDYFNYSISENLTNSDVVETQGFFLGNHQIDLREHLNYLKRIL